MPRLSAKIFTDRHRIAVLSMNLAAVENEQKKYLPVDLREEVYNFALYGADYHRVPTLKAANNFPLASPSLHSAPFDVVVVGASVHLYETDWHKSLFIAMLNMLNCNGLLIFPVIHSEGSEQLSGIAKPVIQRWAGNGGEAFGEFWCFKKLNEYPMPRTVFGWIKERGPTYLEHLEDEFEHSVSGHFLELGINESKYSFQLDEDTTPKLEFENHESKNLDFMARSRFSELEYLGLGTGPKLAILKTAIQSFYPYDESLKYVDHGSACGLVPMQALLESTLNVSQAFAVEPLIGFRTMAFDLLLYLPNKVKERFCYEHSYSETYEYQAPVNVISFFHMFFLIENNEREKVLSRAWEALVPGGFILLFEIPKTEQSKSTHYYERMLTWDDLEAVCGKIGISLYIDPRSLEEVDPGDFLDKPVIRILKKQ